MGLTTEALIDKFSKESMRYKPVCDVPGVGSKLAAELLLSIGITEAWQLYEYLWKLKFDEDHFQNWMKSNVSTHARIPVIYQALMAWRAQFGDDPLQRRNQQSERMERAAKRKKSSFQKSDPSQVNKSSPECAPGLRVSSQMPVSDSSVVEDRPQIVREACNEHGTIARSQSSPQLMQFLASFSTVFKSIPEEFRIEFRRDILNLAEKYERKIKLKENPNESRPSTSS